MKEQDGTPREPQELAEEGGPFIPSSLRYRDRDRVHAETVDKGTSEEHIEPSLPLDGTDLRLA